MPDVDDWGFDGALIRRVRTTAPPSHRKDWAAETARYALAFGVIIGVLVALFALCVAVGILLVGLADLVLGLSWGVPAVFTAACLLVR